MIFAALWFLATIDAALIGYREAAGRNALIDKRRYYRHAMLRGALLGQIAVATAGAVVLTAVLLSGEPASLIAELKTVGARMLLVYVPFAAIILLAFGVRSFPSVDLKSITSTVVFGPFTLLRPMVAAAGIGYGLLTAPKTLIFLLGIFVLALMLSLEKVIRQLRKLNLIE